MDPELSPSLYISDHDGLIKQVFQLAYDELGHPGYHRAHEQLTQGLYIRWLSTQLHEYLRHCPVCQLHQTPHHRPYGNMQPILSPPTPFYTISIDFIFLLPETSEGFNCVLSITDKFSKRITFTPGKDSWRTNDWAKAMLQQLDIAGWGLPKVILLDRDLKFLSTL